MTHTAGEWKSLIQTEGRTVNSGTKRICDVQFVGVEESEANAKLIAAAPELLEALISILADDHNDGILLPTDRVKAKKAIKKATI